MRSFTLHILGALSLALLACGDDGGDDDGSGIDAAPISIDAAERADAGALTDAATGPAENLAVPCPADSCPNDETCTDVDFTGDSTPDTGGFCTVPCDDNADCEDGYGGPGEPTCFLSGPGGMLCAVLCDVATATDCPTGTQCLDLTPDDAGMTAGVCAPPG